MIYRISTNNEQYMAIHIEPKELRAKMGDDIMIHMGAEPTHYLDHWVKPDATFYIPDDFPNAIKIPDLTLWGEFLVFNQKAFDALSVQLGDYGEFMPVNCEGNNYYIFNILKFVDDIAGIDKSQSVRKEQSGIYLGVDKLVFKEDVIGKLLVFRTEFDDYQRVFCTDNFKANTLTEGLNGINFGTELEACY